MATADDVPSAPSLEVLDQYEGHTFVEPLKKINEGHDVSAFLTSKAYGDTMTFLLQLNRAMFPSYVQSSEPNQKRSAQTWELGSSAVTFSETVQCLRSLLEDLNQIIDEVPPGTGPRRFGNASFRRWYEKVEERTSVLLYRYLPPTVLEFPMIPGDEITPADEIKSYFLGSFGSSQRLDYGSGHELSFLAFLGCMWKLGGFDASNPGNEERGIVLGVIDPYLQLVRRLIKTYTLEPAGSHGVWGLDDHSFIPYIFGSAQYGPSILPKDQTPTEGSLEGAPDPADVAKKTAVDRERDKNMYFGAIGFIHDVKKGPFWEHSPMLYDISGVRAGWGKINKGMVKMYNAEVLSKFPVVQHFRFGSLFSWEQDPNAAPPPSSVHTSNQPVRDGPRPSLENASARAPPPPQEGTKAPWASKPIIMPDPGIGTAAPWANKPTTMPGPGVGTAAPWATKPTAMPSSIVGTAAPWTNRSAVGTNARLPPTRFPQQSLRDPGAALTRTQMPLRAKDGETVAGSMPPPTKAPWAR